MLFSDACPFRERFLMHFMCPQGLEMTEREGAAVAPGVEVAEQYVKRRTGGNAN